jgi:hypothetical protein
VFGVTEYALPSAMSAQITLVTIKHGHGVGELVAVDVMLGVAVAVAVNV